MQSKFQNKVLLLKKTREVHFATSLSGLVVRVPGYRSRVPGLIPGATSSGSGTGSIQPREDN
jgi:hypothetical protein